MKKILLFWLFGISLLKAQNSDIEVDGYDSQISYSQVLKKEYHQIENFKKYNLNLTDKYDELLDYINICKDKKQIVGYISFLHNKYSHYLSNKEYHVFSQICTKLEYKKSASHFLNNKFKNRRKRWSGLADDVAGNIASFLNNLDEIKTFQKIYNINLNMIHYLDINNRSPIWDCVKYEIILFKNLKYLDVSSTLINKENINCISNNLKKLKFLNLDNCYKINDECILLVCENLTEIETISLSNSYYITNISFQAILNKLLNLSDLNIKGCSNIDDDALKSINNSPLKLKSLNIHGCRNISDIGIKALAPRLDNLLFLDLTNCSSLSDNGVTFLSEKCKKLKRLSLRECNEITDESVSFISKNCRELVFLDLSWCRRLTKKSLQFIGENCKNLEYLNIDFCPNITSEALPYLYNFPKVLNIKISDAILEFLDLKKQEELCKNLKFIQD